jgi:glutamate racemase
MERYRALEAERPIGVFDSGIGGLTVLEEIATIDRFDNRTHAPGADGRPDFEDESFVYLGDQANMPYGNYPSENRVDFLKELILKDVVFLLGDRYWPSRSAAAPRRDKPPVKAIVIACNTATAYGLEDVHAALERWGIPIFTVGVVAAGADGAVDSLRGMEAPGAVAVMATVGTCRSEGYVREISRSSEAARIDAPQVIQQGSLGLAGAIEGSPEFIAPAHAADAAAYRGPAVGNPEAPIEPSLAVEYGFDPQGLLGDPDDPATWRLNSVGNYISYDTTSLVENHRRSGSTQPIRTVILGCTHFPFYKDEIEASFERLRGLRTAEGEAPYRDLIADEIVFVDPAELTAVQLYEALSDRGLLDNGPGTAATADEFYISVPNPTCPEVELRPDGLGFTYEFKYGRIPGRLDREYVRRVPMSRHTLDEGVLETIRTSMPAVWERLMRFSNNSPRCADLPPESRIGAAE